MWVCVGLVVTHVIRFKTIVTNERDLNRLKDLVAERVGHLWGSGGAPSLRALRGE